MPGFCVYIGLIPPRTYIKFYRSIPRKIQKYSLFRQGKISSIVAFRHPISRYSQPILEYKKKKYTPKEGFPRWSMNRTKGLLSKVYFSRVSSLSTASGQKTSKGKVVSRKKRSILLIPAVERIEKYTLDRGKARSILLSPHRKSILGERIPQLSRSRRKEQMW